MPISEKQKKILAFPYTRNYQALICDGAIRSGKTSIMSVAFIDWAMREFNNTNFAICGKTVGSAIKNIIMPYMLMTYHRDKYNVSFTRADNKMIVRQGERTNTFYIYGGKDESSYMLIQGITLGGVFLDEVALMTRSFVEQALARCSLDGARFWFNCNPASPEHWFYKEWILQVEKHKALHLHFLMTDNPGLSAETLERYENTYSGVFYDRYILGEWVIAEGLVYPNFDAARHIVDKMPNEDDGYWWVTCDYGIVNPFAAHLWHVDGNVAYCVDEYYYDGGNRQRTDEEHYAAVERLIGDRLIQHIVIDPSASSFKETIRRHGRYNVRNADNDVLAGIANCMTLLDTEYVKFSSKCEDLNREMALYSWDADSDKDEVIKENDHAMDSFRYFVQTILRKEIKHINWGRTE